MLRIKFGYRRYLQSFTWVVVAAIFIHGGSVFTATAQDSKAEAAYEAAAGLFNVGLWEQAAAAYKEYFKKHPRHTLAGHAHYGLGLCHFNMKDYASAAKELESAAGSKGPDRVETNLYLGQALMQKTPAIPRNAERAFESALKSLGFSKTGLISRKWDKESVVAWLGKPELAEKKQLAGDVFIGLLMATYLQGHWDSVVVKAGIFEGLVKGSQVEQRVRVLTGEAHEKSEEYKEAAVAYEAAANIKGGDASEALFRVGLVRLNHLKDFESAAKNFHDFADKFKSDAKRPDATFNEALCYYHSYYAGEKPHLNEAIKLFGDFAKANPKHEMTNTAQYYVGKLQHIRGDWMAAMKALEPLMGSEKSSFDQLVFLVADSHHRLKNWGKAAELYMQFAKGNERALNADVALHNAGVSYSSLKEPDTKQAVEAYELLDSKCPRSPHLPSANLKLGIIHYQARRYKEAQNPLRKIPVNHPLKADGDYYLAWTDLDNQKPIDAAKRFKTLGDRLARGPSKHRLTPLCKLYQGIAEFEGARFSESSKTLSKFVSDFPEHEKLDEGAFNMGLAQMELSKWDDAITSFDLVPKKSKIRDRALYQAAWSKRSAAKPAEAIDYYKELLDQHENSSLTDNVLLELAEVEFETGGEGGGADSVKRLTVLLNKKPAPKAGLRRLALYRLGIVQFNRKNFSESAKAFEDMLNDATEDLIISAAWQAGEARRQVAKAAQGATKEREYKAAIKNYEIAAGAKVPTQTNHSRLQEQALLRVGQSKGDLAVTLDDLEQRKAARELWEDSQKSFESFIESHPKHKLIRTAYLGLGWSFKNQENYPNAIKSLEKTVADGVRDEAGAKAQFLLGECYLEGALALHRAADAEDRQKKFDKAITEFAKVETLYAFPQWQSLAAFEMAQALLEKGNKAGARAQFERLIKRYPETKSASTAASELKRLK